MMDAMAAQVASDQAAWSHMLTAAPNPQAPLRSSERLSSQSCASGHGSKAPKHEGPCSIQVKSQ